MTFFTPLSVRMGAISQSSLPGRHPSDIRGMTWPSEGDDVMYEAGWEHKVKVVSLSRRAIVDRFLHRQGFGPWGCKTRLS